MDCREFPKFLNGKVDVISTTYRSRVNLTCKEGYNIVGSSSAVCLGTGTWSPNMSLCISKDKLILFVDHNKAEVPFCICV